MNNQDKRINEEMLEDGTTLQQGRYCIERYISSGGFGNTYLAIDKRFDERVAVKEFFMKGINQREKDNTVSVSNAINTQKFVEQREKFNKEAQRIRKLCCDNIVKVNDLFDENETSYYVMDYIDGLSLRDIVKQHGVIDEETALHYLDQAISALQEVHRKKIFHLDLKPANLMVDKKGHLRVIDFGASKQQKADGSGASASSALCYTPGYAPMEQKDLRFDKFGPWTDIYSLGATMYFVLTGNTPPDGTDIQDEREAAFHFPPTVSDKMKKLIVWMMEYNRASRPQTVEEIRNYLQGERKEDLETEIGTIFSKKNNSPVQRSNNKNAKNRNALWVSVALIAVTVFALSYVVGRKMITSKPNEHLQEEQTIVHNVADIVESREYINPVLGKYLYTGKIDANGMPHGNGTAIFIDNGAPNGNMYEGPFVHGVFTGDKAVFKYGTENTFKGSFENNMYSKGKLTINSSGRYFEGSFYNGEPYNGTWHDSNGRTISKLTNGE